MNINVCVRACVFVRAYVFVSECACARICVRIDLLCKLLFSLFYETAHGCNINNLTILAEGVRMLGVYINYMSKGEKKWDEDAIAAIFFPVFLQRFRRVRMVPGHPFSCYIRMMSACRDCMRAQPVSSFRRR